MDAAVETRPRRPLPAWYDDAKLGIFVHWGPYSVPGWAPTTGPLGEVVAKDGWPAWFRRNPYAEWYGNSMRIPDGPTADYHRATFGPDVGYDDFATMFDDAVAGWDPAAWATLFRDVGARYVVLTTKHHDGFRLWPSAIPNPTKGPYHARRDLVGELSEAVRAAGLRMGLYHSTGLDWTFNDAPIRDLPDLHAAVPQDPAYVAYLDAHLRELIARYRPSVLWADIGSPRAFDAERLFADYERAVPEGVVNDRFKLGPDMTPGAPFDFRTPEYATSVARSEQKFEFTRGIGFSFGYNRNEDDAAYLPVPDLVRFVVDVVSKNGNVLLNVGPTAAGEIPAPQRQRLEGLGAWLRANGDAIFGTRPWDASEGRTGDGVPVRFTRKGETLYAILLGQPAAGPLDLPGLRPAAGTEVRLLGRSDPLPMVPAADRLRLTLPADLPEAVAHTVEIRPLPSWLPSGST